MVNARPRRTDPTEATRVSSFRSNAVATAAHGWRVRRTGRMRTRVRRFPPGYVGGWDRGKATKKMMLTVLRRWASLLDYFAISAIGRRIFRVSGQIASRFLGENCSIWAEDSSWEGFCRKTYEKGLNMWNCLMMKELMF